MGGREGKGEEREKGRGGREGRGKGRGGEKGREREGWGGEGPPLLFGQIEPWSDTVILPRSLRAHCRQGC